MSALLLTVVLALGSPGDAARLAPDPAPSGDAPAASVPAPSSEPEPPQAPAVPVAAIVAAGAAMAAALRWGREGPAPGDALGLSDDPLVVFVPGHGNAPSDFDDLAGLMDLEPSDYRVFDYRWAVESDDPVHASRAAGIDDTADTLDAYLAGLADGERDLYLVGFSKGGAGIAELVSRWDRGESPPQPGVVGAALLDPPLSTGVQGLLQSLGFWLGPVPDDGGYDPVDCGVLRGCVDRRDGLGDASGVEVLVLRNPKAGITNFDDRPVGLRVYDVPDAGRGPLASVLHNPLSYPLRVAEAHDAVLRDPRVAECIRSEMRAPGSCRIPAGASGGGGTGGGLAAE